MKRFLPNDMTCIASYQAPYALYTIGLLLAYGLYRLLQVGKRDARMPPGPPTLPILGNMHQLPMTGLFKQFAAWAQIYGSIYSLKLGPSTIVVLCDRKAIHKLLVERGQKYSHRKDSYIATLASKGESITMGQYNTAWREKRKLITHVLSPRQLDEKHFKVQESEATILLNDLLEGPENFYNHIRRYTASVVTAIVFGYRAPSYEDFWGHTVYDVLEHWNRTMEAGANPPFDEFPFLKYLPGIIAPWRSRAIKTGEVLDEAWREARRRLEERRATGVRRDCVGDNLLDDWEEKGWPITDYGFTSLLAEFVTAGADTTASQILTLILAFAKYPEIQEKAREEIDAVCGTERTPTWSDFKHLPYVNAIVKEGMRWRPTAAAGVPHYLKEDNEYEGMHIPKDSRIFLATWAIHHSEAEFEDHERFNPDRYLKFDKLANDYAGAADWASRDHYGYGAGRRICPGIHLAERNMWRTAAKLLWAYEFAEPLDPVTGQVKPLDADAYIDGILISPLPFEVRITPRSAKHVARINTEKAAALDFLRQYE